MRAAISSQLLAAIGAASFVALVAAMIVLVLGAVRPELETEIELLSNLTLPLAAGAATATARRSGIVRTVLIGAILAALPLLGFAYRYILLLQCIDARLLGCSAPSDGALLQSGVTALGALGGILIAPTLRVPDERIRTLLEPVGIAVPAVALELYRPFWIVQTPLDATLAHVLAVGVAVGAGHAVGLYTRPHRTYWFGLLLGIAIAAFGLVGDQEWQRARLVADPLALLDAFSVVLVGLTTLMTTSVLSIRR